MINWVDWLVLATYSLALFFIFAYSMVQLNLVRKYKAISKRKRKEEAKPLDHLPIVTIQLPLYNEQYVVERLIDAVADIDYPKEKLEIQVLDDSDDGSEDIASRKVKQYQKQGIDIKQIRRPERTGFKAGALQYGLEIARGEFIAVFDADFVPSKQFIYLTIKHFSQPKVGVVQTRWGHLNKYFSILTRLQAFGLDAHFTVEQTGRCGSGHFGNFNGTAGIWRKQCIINAGGWHDDTLTEDLDLSYRAQLKGWQIYYLQDVESPAELPAAMGALKSQQFRWTKGAAESAKKHLANVFKAKLSLATKVHALFHLLNSSVFLCIITAGLLSIPILHLKNDHHSIYWFTALGWCFIISLYGLVTFYWTGWKSIHKDNPKTRTFIRDFFMFLSVSMGLALHNSVAVLEGLLGFKTPFVRTPKYNLVGKQGTWIGKQYSLKHIPKIVYLEMILALYFAYGLYVGYQCLDFTLYPFHLLLFSGFSWVSFLTIKHSLQT